MAGARRRIGREGRPRAARRAWGAATLAIAALALGLLSSVALASAQQSRIFTSFGSLRNIEGLAVDEATGDVYVYDQQTEALYKFNADGEPAEFSALHSDVLPHVGRAFAEVGGQQIAVDNSNGPAKGTIYLAVTYESGPRVVSAYSASGNLLGRLEGTNAPSWGPPTGVAVDPLGRVYVAIPYPRRVVRFVPSGDHATDADYSATLTPEGHPRRIAVDATGNVYDDSWGDPYNGPVVKYAESQFDQGSVGGQEIAPTASTLAVDPHNGDLYLDEVSSIAHYSAAGSLIESLAGAGPLEFGGSQALAVNGTSGRIYVADGLHNRVEIYGVPPIAAPAVSQEALFSEGVDRVTVRAKVNPGYLPTTYYVQYGAADCSGGSCSEVPAAPGMALAGEGGEDEDAAVSLTGLAPETLYHYRFVAVNAQGTVYGPDATFTTLAGIEGNSFQLPDNRAFELVSPLDKAGYGVWAGMVVASSSGDAALFVSGGAFAGVEAGNIANMYVGARGGAGWSTLPIAPQWQTGGVKFADGGEVLYLSPDLSKEIVRTTEPALTPDATPRVSNLYIRDNTTGSYRLITTAVPDPLPSPYYPAFADVTPDFSRVLFQAPGNLIPGSGAPDSQVNLYEWHEGQLSLISTPTPAPEGTVAGDGAATPLHAEGEGSRTNHSISMDGSRIFFAANAGSEVNNSGQLYMKEGSRTVHISASQGSVPVENEVAHFQTASPDGRKVLFTSRSKLTDSAASEGDNLYLYDVASGHLTALTAGGSNAGVVIPADVYATTPDLSYVYFMYGGQIGGGGTAGQENLYLWHDGSIAFIAEARHTGADHGGRSTFGLGDITPDGREIVFKSDSRLTEYDNQGQPEIYLYRASTGGVTCVSCDPSGAAPTGDAKLAGELATGYGNVRYYSRWPRSIAANGDVYFSSPDALVPGDSNGRYDVYQWHEGELRLISTGESEDNSSLGDVSLDGRNVFFQTMQSLVPGDWDGVMDLYDARVEGGFPTGSQMGAPACEAEACRAPASNAPTLELPTSLVFVGIESVQSAPASAQTVKPIAKKKSKPKKSRMKKAKKKRKKHTRKHKVKQSSSGRTGR